MNLIAACAFGLEAIVKRELIALGYEDAHVVQPGRIRFVGDWAAVCRSNLWLRTADRVLIEILSFPAPDFDALYDTVKAFDWSQFLPRDAEFPVAAKTRKSQLTSVPAIQRSVKKAIVESLQRDHATQELDESGETYKVEAALLDDTVTLTLDTTGPSLHKRGYRKLTGLAPIKETLAAAMVSLSVWNPDRILIDPFCGSGTIPIEAAMIGLNLAPGLYRNYASSQWPLISSSHWENVRTEALDLARKDKPLQIIGTDVDDEALSLARYHVQRAGVESQIHFQQKPFSELRSKKEYGCIITNPPYGERLEQQEHLLGLYESIPAVMHRIPTWSLFLITNMPRFEKLIEKKATRRRKLYNGRIECTYYQFLGPRPHRSTDVLQPPEESHTDEAQTDEAQTDEAQTDEAQISEPADHDAAKKPDIVPSQPDIAAPIFSGTTDKDQEQAELFKSRLAKRARHLRRWPSKRGITCYRIYERDIPEIPLIVDRYDDHIHITEYERPHDRDLARHAAWLELMKKSAAAILDVPIQRVILKSRPKNRDRQQYHKLNVRQKLITVEENGLKFQVDMASYIDTGLFLDHRVTRKMVFADAKQTDFLNLFAYTGSFSVYAAAGGANSTTTVDLSQNYLSWAEQNFQLNDLAGPQHHFVASDVITYLENISRDPRHRFDLAVVDPPTYSNSKRTEQDWDVQQRHVELLRLVRSVMRPGGIVYFSTNFRRFKLSEPDLDTFEIREISNQTVPEDFRNRRIHRCWRLVVLPD